MKSCEHTSFQTEATINRLEDSRQFNMDVKVKCLDCGEPFMFLGLPMGLDLQGAAVSPDYTEARLAIAPIEGQDRDRWLKMNGFKIKEFTNDVKKEGRP